MLTMVEYVRNEWPGARKPVFLHVSTDEVYGPTNGKDTHQEWAPIVPSNPYSASKACQEAIAIAYWRSYGLPLILVNLMNNFGERQSGLKFPCILQRKIRRGETVTLHRFKAGYGSRYYIHSRNAADAMLHLLRTQSPYVHVPGAVDKPRRLNIVGDEQVDNYALARFIADTLKKELKFTDLVVLDERPGHDGHYGLSGDKMAELGWKAPLTFRESLKNTIAWYEENPEWLDPK
jgi:dTDP-glucose 4,6-dehydratase